MTDLKIPEINLTSDSDELTEDNWFTSPTTSFDGSSVNSIPWADDVIKQNKDEWEHIERMFYGEDDLPDDKKLRNEILEWTNRFLHLRVMGKQASIYHIGDERYPSNVDSHVETLAIHPICGSARHQPSTYRHHNGKSTNSRMNVLFPVRESYSSIDNELEKHLQIASRPLLARRNVARSPRDNNTRMTSIFTPTGRERTTTSALHSVRSNFDGRNVAIHNECDGDDALSATLIHSARIVNVPETAPKTRPCNTMNRIIRINTANAMPMNRPLRNSITLPAINIVPIYAEPLASSRSISKNINSNVLYRNRLPSYVAFKKRSESE